MARPGFRALIWKQSLLELLYLGAQPEPRVRDVEGGLASRKTWWWALCSHRSDVTWGPWWPAPGLQRHHGSASMRQPATGNCLPAAKSPTLQRKPHCIGFEGGEAFWAYTFQGGSWSPLCGSQSETRGLDFQKVGGLALAENKIHLSCHDSSHLERFRPCCLVSQPFP